MPKRSSTENDWDSLRQSIIGLGELSARKSYYPELQQRLHELEAAKNALDLANSQLQAMFNAATEMAVIATDRDGLITFFNRGAERMLWYAADDVVGVMTPLTFHLEEEVARRRRELSRELGREMGGFEVFAAVAREQGAESGNWTYLRRDGRHILVKLTITVIRAEDGQVGGYLGIAEDITERMRAETDLAQSRELLNTIIESIPNPIFFKDTDGVYENCNRAFAEFIGLPREKIIGATAFAVAPGELAEVYRQADLELMRQRGTQVYETQVRDAAGHLREVIFYKSAILQHDGSVRGVVGVMLDITERKRTEDELHLQALRLEQEIVEHQRAEEALQERERMLSLVINAIPQAIFWKDTDSVYLGCNDNFARAAGLSSPAEVIGKTDYELPWLTEETEGYRADDREVMRTNQPRYRFAESQRTADGRLTYVETTKIPLHAYDGSVMGILGVYDDVTERRQAEEALRESEQRLRLIFDTSQAGIILVSPAGEITFANQRMAEMFGYSPGALPGTPYPDLLYPTEHDLGDFRMRQLIAGEIEQVSSERHYRRLDGSDFWGYLSGKRLEDSNGNLQALLGIIADISELKAARDALESEKELMTVTLRSIGDGVISVDTAGRVILLNRAAEQFCGWTQEEAIGRPLGEVFSIRNARTREPLVNPVELVLKTREVVELANNAILVSRDGSELVIAESAAPLRDPAGNILGVVLAFRNITQKREMEEALLRARKLESIGVLAGGIAHDFNNLLTGVLGNISMARTLVSPQQPVYPLLDRAQKASERARDLTQQLLAFSKGGAPVKKLTSLKQLLVDSATFVLRGSNVRCEFDISHDLWPVEVDPGQMSQVVNNLVINADQSMPDGGVITVRAENVPLPERGGEGASQHRGMVRITIEDTGGGIADEDLHRIFDPYFTTKQHGSGLGLATVFFIVKNHGGEIRVFTRPERGTSFVIELPASEKALTETAPPVVSRSRGAGAILVMDDDPLVLEMAEVALKMLGYQPTLSRDGGEALRLYEQAAATGTPYRAVIMDLTIPGGMGGKETARKLLQFDPAARVIVSSGYSIDQVLANYREYGFCAALGKPYNLEELGKALREAFGENS